MINNFAKQVIENGGNIHPLLLPSTETGGTGIMNPSIFIDGDKILCNIRHVNYTLFHCEGEQLFGNRYGPLAYINPENDIKLRTNNFLCELNKDFTIKTWNKIDTTKLDIQPVWEFIGLEDARVVRWEDKLFFTGVRRDTKTNGEGRMELSEIVDNKEIRRDRIEPPNDPNSYCEKNWMPVLDMPYHYVKWTNPTELVKVDRDNRTSETIHLKNGFDNLQNLRGGSHIIPYKNKRICIIHECDLWKNKLNQKDAKYTHRFVMWDLDWNIEWISDSFSFMDGEIEFCCGLAEYNNELLISFGFQDNAAFILRMPTKYFDEMCKINNKKILIKKLNGLNLVNCISLESSKDRQEKTINEFNKFEVNVKVIQAYDGRVIDYQKNSIVEGLYLHQMDSGAIATVLSHLKAIKDWYNTTNEDYGVFCEDDMLISNSNNWLFNWNDVINNLPKDWKAIQLSVIKDIKESDMKLNIRKWDNWACGIYILSRTYAKKIIDKYYPNDTFILINDNLIPLVENIIYGPENKDIYTLPLFTEDTSFKSTFYPKFSDTEYKNNQKLSADFIKKWWEQTGKLTTIKDLCKIN